VQVRDTVWERDMTTAKDERALRVLSVLAGSIAMIVYPVVDTYGSRPLVLAFAIPLAMATSGRLLGRAWLEPVAAVVGIALVVVVFTSAVQALEWLLVLGPVVAMWAVTDLLRSLDRLSGALWLVAAVVAYASGLLLSGNAAVVAGMAAIVPGGTFALLRRPRWSDSDD
jgi:hypothetical protein